MKIQPRIEKTSASTFEACLTELLNNLGSDPFLRLVFFGSPADNSAYLRERAGILEAVRQRFGDDSGPLVSYVAQPPLDCTLAVEAIRLPPDQPVAWHRYGAVRYAVADHPQGRWLFTEGILPSSFEASIDHQSVEVLDILGAILAVEKMPLNAIVRQWNYIERITALACDTQHYQEFNDARSHFYAQVQWPAGYPAATGIGTVVGGVMVEVDALLPVKLGGAVVVALDNALQVAAHDYSQEVLIGTADRIFREKTTPKFERAKAIVTPHDGGVQLYISGTAAIRGQQSLSGMGAEHQTIATLENITYLISPANLEKHGVKTGEEAQIKNFRVYLKDESSLEPARKVVEERHPTVPALYLLTDVCRDELLVEIEGLAQVE